MIEQFCLSVFALGEKQKVRHMLKIKELPVNDRPYEKCYRCGAEILTDTELLSVILRTGTRGISAYDLSNQILNHNNNKNLLTLKHITKEQLLGIKGIGMVKAVQVLCISELSKRLSLISFDNNTKFNNAYLVSRYYMEKLRHLEQEHLYVMFLDTKCKLIKDKLITAGTVNKSLISPREIFIESLRCGAVNIILVHNHPSGDPTPSREDITSTINIHSAGELVGVTLLDHIIIGDNIYSSLKELKLFQ